MIVKNKKEQSLLRLVPMVLNNLDKITEDITDVLDMIEESSVFSYKSVFQLAIDYHSTHGKYPSGDYLSTMSNGILVKLDIPFTMEFYEDFRHKLIEECAVYRAISALHDGDKDKAMLFLEKHSKNEHIKPLLDFNDLDTIYDSRSANSKGIKTGIPEIDGIIKLIPSGSLTALGAFSGVGKSTCAYSIMYYNLVHEGKDVVFVSLEIPDHMIGNMLVSRHALEIGHDLPAELINKYILSDEQKELYRKVKADFVSKIKGRYAIFTPEHFQELTPTGVGKALKSIYSVWGNKLDLLIWDYLQCMKHYPLKGVKEEKERINFWTRYLQTISLALDSSVLGLSQTSRTGHAKLAKTHIGDMSHFSEANEIDRACSLVIEGYSDEAMRLGNSMDLHICKHRNGATHVSKLNVYANFSHNKVGDIQFQDMFNLDSFSNFQSDLDALKNMF